MQPEEMAWPIQPGWCRGYGTECPGRWSKDKCPVRPSDCGLRPRRSSGEGRAASFLRRRFPSRPFSLATDLGDAGPSLRILADDRAVANRPALGQHVVDVARV